MNKILISGSSGFVGKNLCSYLSNYNFDIVNISRDELKQINVSIFDKVSTLIHLAGKAHDLKNTSNPEEYYEVNFEITKKLYDAFLRSDAKKFVFISSVKAVADSVDGVLTEDVTPNPQTHYGKSKLMAEDYIQSQPLPKGKSYFILRPCMIHGPRNKGNLNLLYQIVKKGIPYPLAAFENKRSFLSVENFCFVIKGLIDKEIDSGIYQVADDEALSTNEVVKILAQASGKKAQLWQVSKGIVTLLAHIGNILHLPLNTEKLNKLTESYVVSNGKIKLAIDGELPVNTRDGLRLTAKSFAD